MPRISSKNGAMPTWIEITVHSFFFFNFIYLFRRMGSSLWHVGSFVAASRLLSSCGSRAQGSVVVAHGLSSCGARA